MNIIDKIAYALKVDFSPVVIRAGVHRVCRVTFNGKNVSDITYAALVPRKSGWWCFGWIDSYRTDKDGNILTKTIDGFVIGAQEAKRRYGITRMDK